MINQACKNMRYDSKERANAMLPRESVKNGMTT